MRIHVLILSCLAWAISCHPQELERLADEIMAREGDVNQLAENLASATTQDYNELLLSTGDDVTDADEDDRVRFRASITTRGKGFSGGASVGLHPRFVARGKGFHANMHLGRTLTTGSGTWSPAVPTPGFNAGQTIKPTDACPGIHVSRREAMLIELGDATFMQCLQEGGSALATDQEEEGDDLLADLENSEDADPLLAADNLDEDDDAITDNADADADRVVRRTRITRRRRVVRRTQKKPDLKVDVSKIQPQRRYACAQRALTALRAKFPGNNGYRTCIMDATSSLLQVDEGEDDDSEDNDSEEEAQDGTQESEEEDSLLSESGELVIGHGEEADSGAEESMDGEDVLLTSWKGGLRVNVGIGGGGGGGGGGGFTNPPSPPPPQVVTTPPPAPADPGRLNRICEAQQRLRAALYRAGTADAARVRLCLKMGEGGGRSLQSPAKAPKPAPPRNIHVHIHGTGLNGIRQMVRDTIMGVLVDFYRARMATSGAAFRPAPFVQNRKTKAGFDPYDPHSWLKR